MPDARAKGKLGALTEAMLEAGLLGDVGNRVAEVSTRRRMAQRSISGGKGSEYNGGESKVPGDILLLGRISS